MKWDKIGKLYVGMEVNINMYGKVARLFDG
jgi:hypothetical protein